MADRKQIVCDNLKRVRERIARACESAGRDQGDVRLVGVTKYVDADTARLLVECGCVELGESRPQSLWEKAEALGDTGIQWHQIGHLQRNKVRRTLLHVALVHSVDSERLLKSIDNEARSLDRSVDVLVEVNISGDASKHGFRPSDVRIVREQAAACQRVNVRGLMGMAGRESSLDEARRQFGELRTLRDQLRLTDGADDDMHELSMGMSHDLELAIEQGATIVRVGSALFEGIRS